MIKIWKAGERGHANHGWLDTWHTFSFGEFHDPNRMGFRSLRVINEDWVAPGMGFGMHPHRDMEIVTYVLEGALQHKDSMGNGEVLKPGEFQHMSAGTGIRHSEFNPSATEKVHLYQIWLLPKTQGIKPTYAQKAFPVEHRIDRLCLVASPTGEEGSLAIHQDASIYLANVSAGKSLTGSIVSGRHGWIQVLRGSVRIAAQTLQAGDAAAISEQSDWTVDSPTGGELMFFDLA